MKKQILVGLVFSMSLLLMGLGCGQNSTVPNPTVPNSAAPKVISTFPQNGAQNVDPSVTEIWVQFDKPMMDKSWSWAYMEKDKFPALNGSPYYSEQNTKNILPVKLESNHEYVIWINTDTLKNFKDTAGTPAEPYEFKFKTR